jgi:hypothetical protein
MHTLLRSLQRALHARGFVLLAVALLVAASCGTPRRGSNPPDVAGTLALTDTATLEIPEGAVLRPESDSPLVWSSIPTATLIVTTGESGLSTRRIEVGNLHPDAELRLESVAPASDQSGISCESDLSRTIDCTDSTDSACTPASLERTEDRPPTRATFVVEPEACRRLTYEIAPPAEGVEPLRFAAIGRTDGLDDLDAILDRVENVASLDFALLLGDHGEEASADGLESLGRQIRRRSVPVVVTPGDGERVDGALSAFRGTFGGISLTWQLAERPFATVASAQRTLGSGGVESLRNRLRDDIDGTPVLATHTPPLDPRGSRSAGFDSTIEGGRVASLVTRRSIPLLVTGHLPTRERETMGETEHVVASSLERQQFTLFERTGRGWRVQRR